LKRLNEIVLNKINVSTKYLGTLVYMREFLTQRLLIV